MRWSMADKKVIIYSTPPWPYCKQVKEYLSQKGISFTDYDVAADKGKAKEMIKLTKQMSVPVIVVDDEFMVGFNQSKLNQLLS